MELRLFGMNSSIRSVPL